MISSRLIGGSNDANHFASIVFQDPGGHSRRILCPPEAAISIDLFACSCPIILSISTHISFLRENCSKEVTEEAGIGISHTRIEIVSCRLSTGII